MPVIKPNELPVSIDPKNESVFDPLYKTLMRKAVSISGMDDPATAVLTSLMPTPLVAGVLPEEIGALRQAGKDLLERIRSKGLERRSVGQIPLKPEAFKEIYGQHGITRARAPVPEDYQPNIPVPEDLMNALDYAQKKYPRIFGHLKDITDVDSLAQIRTAGTTRGASGPAIPQFTNNNPTKFSNLSLNASATGTARPDVATVGHELLHSADRIVNPNMLEGYKASLALPGGYRGSAYEARANVQGKRFANSVAGIPNPKPVSLSKIEETMMDRYKVNPPLPPHPTSPEADELAAKFKELRDRLTARVSPDGYDVP